MTRANILVSRVRDAQRQMNLAPTAFQTRYWFRVWRARRKVLSWALSKP